jgi:lysophospholipase L1-like esterase
MDVVSSTPMAVTYPAPMVTGGRQPVTSSCNPASGAEFARGTTSVLCFAQDGAGATVGCSFNVRVRGAAQLSLTSFMAFGDSLTQGTVAPSALRLLTINSQSYPFKLEGLLRARYPNQSPTVANAGEAGEQATEGALRFHSTLLSVRPTAVLLMEGSNDLFFWRDQAIARAMPALATMINDAQTHGVEVFLATIPPQPPTGPRAAVAALIPAFNEAIRGLARDRGVTLVDVEPIILEDMSLIGNDDLHLTERGYDKLAELFLRVIQETLEVEAGG